MSSVTSQDSIGEHMEVVCSGGMHVGPVDHVQGDLIRLTRRDSDDGRHHLIPTSLVASVDNKAHLSRPCDEVKKIWISE
jgi:hypothetical protein